LIGDGASWSHDRALPHPFVRGPLMDVVSVAIALACFVAVALLIEGLDRV
jgi:hypothetical protein